MKLAKIIAVFSFVFGAFSAIAGGGSPIGSWTSIDDQTGAKRAVIAISKCGKGLCGTVVKIYPQPGDTGICSSCPGKFKGKKILGMTIMWGVRDEGNGEWGDGKILDPKTGKIYSVRITLTGNKLLVRGYMGVSLLGRTQTWVR